MFRASLTRLEGEREECLRLIASLETHREVPRHLLTRENLARFAAAAGERLHAEDATLRKGYVRQFIDRVEVGDKEIRVMGPQAALADGLLGSHPAAGTGVPSFAREWWAHQDSSLGPADREARYDLARQCNSRRWEGSRRSINS